ncbi:MAG: hypothetical protein KJ706_04145 [Candidatus Omnitrophica bacterium]|nr:hypothetical protein [Candidatus Omnitrophota bacterium]
MKKNPALSIILIFFTIAFLNIFPAYPADNSSPEKVTDISDRKYEEALIELLDNAKESIVVSMYGISPGAGEKNPVLSGATPDRPRSKTSTKIFGETPR